MKKGQRFDYIIETHIGLLYTGITNNMYRRFQEHLGPKKNGKGAKFFHFDRPKKVVYLEKVENRSHAARKEALIKKMTKIKKKDLIKNFSLRSEEIIREAGLDSL